MADSNFRQSPIHRYAFSEEILELLPLLDKPASDNFPDLRRLAGLLHEQYRWAWDLQSKLQSRMSDIRNFADSSTNHRDSAILFLERVCDVERKMNLGLVAIFELQQEVVGKLCGSLGAGL
ncbi:MAG: hypothetical protein Q9186_007079 [Xanthomendoza sp. 1 TL-2023]